MRSLRVLPRRPASSLLARRCVRPMSGLPACFSRRAPTLVIAYSCLASSHLVPTCTCTSHATGTRALGLRGATVARSRAGTMRVRSCSACIRVARHLIASAPMTGLCRVVSFFVFFIFGLNFYRYNLHKNKF